MRNGFAVRSLRADVRRMRGWVDAALCGLILVIAAGGASAQDAVRPEDEFRQRVRVSEDIQPLGENPFGEQVSLSTGDLSFEQSDIHLTGTGPSIDIVRTYTIRDQSTRDVTVFSDAFGDWTLSLPRITTLSANQQNVKGWVVEDWTTGISSTARYSKFAQPPVVGSPPNDSTEPPWDAFEWWNGYKLTVPGAGTQDLLLRDFNNHLAPAGIDIVTRQNWIIACLPTTANGQPGEAFLATAPDGTRYWFNHLVYQPMTVLGKAGATKRGLMARSMKPSAIISTGGSLKRLRVSMLVTRVEDRFGNHVDYQYDGLRLMRITASDGREVSLTYAGNSIRISTVTVQPNAPGARTWRYSYSSDVSSIAASLTAVTQPDGSQWTFDLGQLESLRIADTYILATCDAPPVADPFAASYTGRMTHPSGLSATFNLGVVARGRSFVRKVCDPVTNNADVPLGWVTFALHSKRFTGANVDSTWNYRYSPPNASWNTCTGYCPTTEWTDVTSPDGRRDRYTFSNRYDGTEGQQLSLDSFDPQGNLLRSERNTYAEPTAGPWPFRMGSNELYIDNYDRTSQQRPLLRRDILQDGVIYTWAATSYDEFAQPVRTSRWNNAPGQQGIDRIDETFSDKGRWVLGLPSRSVNVGSNEELSRNVYDPNSLTLSERYRFGRKVMGYTFDAQGQLASFTDGNGHTTGLENYYRGIPRIIRYPDGTAQTVAVDDLGQITAIADQTGALTSYSYDAIGRLARIDYPAGDSVAWAPKTFWYGYIGAARGVGGAHWMRMVTQGNWSQRMDYDAMLRPVAYGEAEANTGIGYRSSRTDYDWAGRKTFQSYTVDGAPDLAGMALGTVTRYDVLGRPIQLFQHTELGDLLTSTEYLAGGARRVTDPKGNVTTTRYQMLDQPSYNSVIAVEAPEGISQTIQRDIYGNPLSITQGGQGLSLTKTMTYDGEHRLCRTWEPESGSEIMAYDGADNLAWSVSGASFNGTGCGQEQVADALKTVRGYDAMNRVTSVVYPAGTEPSSFTYDARGNPATATAGMASWTFGRNKMGLLTAEVLSIDGWSWALGYGYDPKGTLSTIAYPDGTIVGYAPNGMRQPTQVGGYASGISYFPDGDVKSYYLGNGAIYTSDKNARQMLRNFTYGKGGAPNVSEDFAYDANGNVSQITDVSGTNQRSKAMGYDGLNRLVSATAGQLWGTESYTYDTLNNIRTLTNGSGTNTYNYDGANLLRSIGNGASVLHSFNYDARGNTTVKDSQTLNFDLANRLTSIPGKGSYTYDAAGRRVKKVTPQGTTYYAYNAAGQLMWEYDPATTNGTKYVYLGKKLVANAKAPTSKVIGAFYGPAVGDDVYVAGWACSTGLPRSIDVHIYIGGVAGVGTLFGAYPANRGSEPSLNQECKANGDAYRFQVLLPDSLRLSSGGQPIYIYGISPVGNENAALTGSGQMVVPRSVKVPPKPASVTATLSGDLSTIQVAWSASATATRYEALQVHDGQWTTLYTGAGLAATVGQPTDGAYAFDVRACNDNGCSDLVESAIVNVAHLPTTPGSINIPASSTGSVAISWAAATYATSYQVEHSYDGNWTQVYNGTATSATITETVSSNWYYRVRACNAHGCSGYATSGYVAVTVPPSGTPTLYGAGTNNSGAYTLSWTGVDGATLYNLVESANGGGWQQVLYAATGNWSASGKPDGTYVYQVQACNASGCGPWSIQAAVQVRHVPPTPSGLDWRTLVQGKIQKFFVFWQASPGATRYEVVRWGTGDIVYSGPLREVMVEADFYPADFSYGYQVRACNDSGCSALSYSL
ncbi:MAG: tRNA3(Ser)-specific nuclease WapA [Luteibacter sp.]|uniref:hypothetical protein n=1 Tax=Luteibacter sp. TaxID=1886636 RepID=UPI0013856E48|nr:hypothetical protein [Luteibacter sp.]KAF1007071.1 MAG: tRNA3(Ser)-specific nuclease WapA [Luteibacter sp.]